jgi:glycosyltransferase involved in cell wall biosynthesis
MLSASAIICSHNPRSDYLQRAIAGLRGQDLPLDQWELLLVDNASDKALTAFDLSWHPRGRYIHEPQIGLSAARCRGVGESNSPLLVFVDDDNVLEPNFIRQALTIARARPKLGVWGGTVLAEFESEPTASVKKHIGYLAIRNRAKPCCSNSLSCQDAVPVGAGLCVRAVIAQAYVTQYEQSKVKITGRSGTNLSGYDDFEICMIGCKMGFEIGTFPELRLLHLISSERVSEDYFVRLIGSTDYSGFLLDYKWHGTIPQSPLSLYRLAAFVKNGIFGSRTDRRISLRRMQARIAARRTISQYLRGKGRQ